MEEQVGNTGRRERKEMGKVIYTRRERLARP